MADFLDRHFFVVFDADDLEDFFAADFLVPPRFFADLDLPLVFFEAAEFLALDFLLALLAWPRCLRAFSACSFCQVLEIFVAQHLFGLGEKFIFLLFNMVLDVFLSKPSLARPTRRRRFWLGLIRLAAS